MPVTLSDVHAVKPTFTIPAAPDFVYPHAISFSLTVDDPYGGTDTTVDSVNIGVTATDADGDARSPARRAAPSTRVTSSPSARRSPTPTVAR